MSPARRPLRRGVRFGLAGIVALGLVARLALVAASNVWPALQPADARGYDDRAWALVLAWRAGAGATGFDLPFSVFGAAWTRYDELVAAVYALVGHWPWLMQALNAAIGVLAALEGRAAARALGSPLGGNLTLGLLLYLPSCLYFTSLNLKEAVVLYATLGTLLWLDRLLRRPTPPAAALLVADMALLTFVRAQAGLLIAVAVVASWLVGLRGRRLAGAAIGSLAVAGCAVALLHFSGQLHYLLENVSLARLTVDRVAQAELAGSQLGPTTVFSTPGEALAYLPLGLLYFALAPLPWQAGGAFGAAAQVEMLLWYALLPFAALGLGRAMRRGERLALIVTVVVAVYAVAAALVVGNVGGLYRYRLPIWAILFVWAELGLGETLVRRGWLARLGRPA